MSVTVKEMLWEESVLKVIHPCNFLIYLFSNWLFLRSVSYLL